MATWHWLVDILVLLSTALVFGTLAEQLKQSAIIGYIVAGMLVGPGVMGLVSTRNEVDFYAELGVTLLLFSIGLEFSFRRLIRMGKVTLLGGSLQVLLTAAASYFILHTFGIGWKISITLGMMIALSSTAVVARVLIDTNRIDSIFGRNAIGILLLQDIVLLPLVILTVALGGNNDLEATLWILARTAGLGLLMFGGFYFVFNYLIPKLLKSGRLAKNRDFPILLAVVMALGAAWAFHSVGLSPALGAFIAGLLLAESPFAVQIRSDVAPLKTLMVTMFFAAIGMLVNPVWVLEHAVQVGIAAAAVIVFKPLIIFGIVRLLGFGNGIALATGFCLGQVGEFSFVLAKIAETGGIIDRQIFRMVVSVAVVTFVMTPYMIKIAPVMSIWAESQFGLRKLIRLIFPGTGPVVTESIDQACPEVRAPIMILGFGPAGQRVAEVLLPYFKEHLVVLDSNPKNADWAESLGLNFHPGNARSREVLEHLKIHCAKAVIITIPDPNEARHIIHLCRSLAPGILILVRSRYHIHKWELIMAGADIVIDEEDQVGERLAESVLEELNDKGVKPQTESSPDS
ncbi:cation:proton antiporter [Gemmatimonadota bacterium]